ncbi:MAG: hypothetical protein ABI569_08815 [Casimicrobiaceae bacterium]
MTKSLLRTLFVLAGATLFFAATAPATAATLTYNDPNCAGFQITGGGGSFTLTCAKLQCSISGTTNPTTLQNTSLTATCTPAGGSYLWSLVSGPFSAPTCQAPSTPTAATTAINKPSGIVAGDTKSCLYQVTGTAAPLSGQAMVTVTWTDAPATPPVCTPSGVTNPSPMTSAGGTIALNANCVPSAGITYTWTRTAPSAGAPTNSTTATPSDTMANNPGSSAVNYTWQVVACTSGTTCDTKTISASVPGTGGLSCPGFAKTIVVDIPWNTASPAQFLTQNFGDMTANTAVVIRLNPAPVGTVFPVSGHINGSEFGDPATNRNAVVSMSSCDWTNSIGNNFAYRQVGTISFNWDLGVAATHALSPGILTMAAGTTYYINVKNTDASGTVNTCAGATCNMTFGWTKPH